MQEEKIGYKIEAGRKYRLFKKEFNGNVYYNIQISQKNYDGTSTKWYRPITFKKGVNIEDPTGQGVDIIIKTGFENLRENKADKYNPIVSIMVTDFEICERKEEVVANAYADFQNNLNENESDPDLPF